MSFGFDSVRPFPSGLTDPVTLQELNRDDDMEQQGWPGPVSREGLAVSVDANRSDEEPWRLERLRSVLGWMEAHTFNATLCFLASLYDHKGTLTVVWIHQPTQRDRQVVENAWEAHNECHVEHVGLDYEPVDLGVTLEELNR